MTNELLLMQKMREDKYFYLKNIISMILMAAILSSVFSTFIIFTKVDGESMMPTLKSGEFKLAYRLPAYMNKYNFQDIVVFNTSIDNKIFVKRIIGLPGDNIRIENNRVYRNDVEIIEDYINHPIVEDGLNVNGELMGTDGSINVVVPKNNLFVLGDNRFFSLDSRFDEVGFVNFNDVIGVIK